jgi:hypothetical protein
VLHVVLHAPLRVQQEMQARQADEAAAGGAAGAAAAAALGLQQPALLGGPAGVAQAAANVSLLQHLPGLFGQAGVLGQPPALALGAQQQPFAAQAPPALSLGGGPPALTLGGGAPPALSLGAQGQPPSGQPGVPGLM